MTKPGATWTYCRNCLAWRDSCVVATIVAADGSTAKEMCRDHANEARIALCGHRGDYDLPGWDVFEWSRDRLTYGGGGTKDEEAIWFSPTCLKPRRAQQGVLL